MNKLTAICPGSFDPVTVGHLDIISRASKMFDKLIVVILPNKSKSKQSFSVEERIEFIKTVTNDLPNVSVDYYDGLLADYAKNVNAGAIIKGLRAMSDFEYEFQMALTNKALNPDVETIFLTTSAQYMYLSSSVVREVASLGGDISNFVPESIRDDIIKRLHRKEEI